MTGTQDSFFELIRNAPFGIHITDADFKLIEISEGARRVFKGIEPLIGRDFSEILQIVWDKQFVDEVLSHFRHTLDTGESYYSHDTTNQRKNIEDVETYDWKIDRIVLPDGTFGVVCYFYDLTERREYEKKIRDSESLKNDVLNSIQSCISVLDAEGNIISQNENWKNHFLKYGNDAEKLIGSGEIGANYLEICRSAVKDGSSSAQTVLKGIEKVLNGESDKFSLEYSCLLLPQKHWFRLDCTPLTLTHGGVVVSYTDITEQKETENALRISEENYRNLFDNNPIPMWVYDLETLRFLQVNESVVHYYGYSREEFLAMTIKDIRPPQDIERLIDSVVNTKKSLNRAGIWNHLKKDGAEIQVEIVSHLIDFNEKKARLVMANEVTERVQAEKNLKLSEERYRLLFENNPFPLIIYDFETLKLIDVNDACCGHYGYTRDEFLSLKITDVIVSPDLDKVKEQFFNNQDKDNFYGIWKNRKKDGTEIWVETASHKLKIEGKNSRIVLANDITEKRKAEEQLREVNQRFRMTFEHAAVGVAHVSLDGKWILVNETVCNITGYSKEELAAMNFQDITHPEDRDKSAEFGRTIIDGEINTYSLEKRYVRKDNSITWVNITVSLVRDKNGNPEYFISVLEDINQRKKTELELRQWAEAFENCAHGIGIGNAENNTIIAINSAFANLLGMTKSEIEGNPILSIYDPKVRQKVKESIESADQIKVVQYETLMLRNDGSAFPAQMDLVSLPDENGKPYRRIATMQDISKRKEAEKSLRESEEKLRFFIENVPVAVAMFDREMNYLAVSRRWMQDVEMDEHGNVIGKNHYEIFKNMPESWIAVHQRALAGAIEKAEEDKFFQPDGSFIWLKWEVRPWHNAEGEIGGIIIFSENITERKRRAEYLKFLIDISDRLNSLMTISEIVDYFGEKVGEYIGASVCAFVEIYQEGNEAVIFDEWRRSGQSLIGKYDLSEYVTDEFRALMSAGELVVVRDILQDSRIEDKERFASLEIGALLNIPLLRNGQWKFSLGIYHKTLYEWRADDVEMMTEAARRIWNKLEQLRAEESLRFEKERFEKIALAAPSLISSLRISADGEISFPFVSQAVRDIYGFGAEEIKRDANLLFGRVHPEDIGRINESIAHSMTTMSVWAEEFRYEHPEKGEVWIEGYSAPVLEQDNSVIWHGIINDVTNRIKTEHEILRLNESLEQKVSERTSELNAVNKELEAFSYSVSHDLRAPLRAIDGFSLALLEDYEETLDDEGKNYLQRVRAATQKMAQLIDDLLKLSRLSRSELIIKEVNLSNIVKEITAQLQEFQPKISVELNIEAEVFAVADERLIRIALENLLNNAWKFTSKKEKAEITFGQISEKNETIFFVKDNGAGFDMQFAGKLFGAFQRLHTTQEFDGTGIGLATVQRIINRHRGRVWAESKLGEGTTFYFSVGKK
ncbi:MAG TPA: PAS domain S-box protein [Pyrinomonadaceae bacterium]|nr:PAS domain S-box protein [Pyrinomonadaceae bacterium]